VLETDRVSIGSARSGIRLLQNCRLGLSVLYDLLK
jgi:hypothetical protein